MLLKGMIIKCSSHIHDERSINSIYHLLTGKRSIQTVQDAHLYKLDRFFGIYKKLNQSTFDEIVNDLVNQEFLTTTPKTDSVIKTTAKGRNWLSKNEHHIPFAYFNGLTYHGVDIVFLERLLLLIQVLTNSKNSYTSYIAVIDRPLITRWVKQFYKVNKTQVDILLEKFYNEIYSILITCPENEAELFVDRLTGFQHYGLSIQQLAMQYKITKHDVELLLMGIIHHMLRLIQHNIAQYPLLSELIADLQTTGFITQSAQRTYDLINKGCSIDMIAQQRNLKINTIYDHIVEISLYDSNFPVERFVSSKQQNEILQIAEDLKTTKLKEIKEAVNEEISYFQIRLALTKKDKLSMK